MLLSDVAAPHAATRARTAARVEEATADVRTPILPTPSPPLNPPAPFLTAPSHSLWCSFHFLQPLPVAVPPVAPLLVVAPPHADPHPGEAAGPGAARLYAVAVAAAGT